MGTRANKLRMIGTAVAVLLVVPAPGFGGTRDYKGPACADIYDSQVFWHVGKPAFLLTAETPDKVEIRATINNPCVGVDGTWGPKDGSNDDEVTFSATAFLYKGSQVRGQQLAIVDVPAVKYLAPDNNTQVTHDVIFEANFTHGTYDGACYEIRSFYVRKGQVSDVAPDPNPDGSASQFRCSWGDDTAGATRAQ